MDIISAYREVGSYRGAAAISGTTAKTVKRVIARHESGGAGAGPGAAGPQLRRGCRVGGRAGGEDQGQDQREAVVAGRPGGGLRGVGAQLSAAGRGAQGVVAQGQSRGRRPAVWSPGEHLVIDWGVLGGLHVFCAVLAWSRVRFVRFADNERAETTLALLAECFGHLGGVPGVVLADRMGCLKGGVVANRVVPTGAYLRFAAHHGFRPDFCEAADPESKGIVENLVGYAKTDLMIPGPGGSGDPFTEWRRRTPRPRGGVSRSTPRSTARFVRCRSSGCSSSGNCWLRCPRCGAASARW